MFRFDRSQNRMSRLIQKRFFDLNLRERDHVQEWLANQSDALGSEHLKIQTQLNGLAKPRGRIEVFA